MQQTQTGKYKFISFTDNGAELMKKLAMGVQDKTGAAPGAEIVATEAESLKLWTGQNFEKGNVLVYIGAMGIAVRAVSPFITDKTVDPAVIVIDEKGENVIPVLSGHMGGAVREAKMLSEICEGRTVITTATDVNGIFAVDVFAKDKNLIISDMKKAREFSSALLKNKRATCRVDEKFSDYMDLGGLPNYIVRTDDDKADLIISPKKQEGDALCLIPKCIVIGMGCKKGKSADELHSFAKKCLDELGLLAQSVAALGSADIKKDEAGLIETAGKLGAEFKVFTESELAGQKGEFTSSEFVKSTVGVDNVCERAVMALGADHLIMKKKSEDGMTFAAGVRDMRIRKLYVAGIGPGGMDDMTIRARKAIEESDVISGYTLYCDLVKPYFPDKKYISTAMTGEEERVKLSFEEADSGRRVTLICSGDAGVYGLAGLAAKMHEDYPKVELEIIPGVTAALSGGALLGAPLIHDFCLISLSDRLTSWETIEKRLVAAAESDMVIVLYNPESRHRKGYLKRACGMIMDKTGPKRVCGIVRNIGREGQSSQIMTLDKMADAEADMFSTVFIGNSNTTETDMWMITPRGYNSEK